jgi:hypothetical protein
MHRVYHAKSQVHGAPDWTRTQRLGEAMEVDDGPPSIQAEQQITRGAIGCAIPQPLEHHRGAAPGFGELTLPEADRPKWSGSKFRAHRSDRADEDNLHTGTGEVDGLVDGNAAGAPLGAAVVVQYDD